MCGIAGLIDPLASPADRLRAVEAMCGAMVHRGPDDAGIESRGDATLGIRRLAIYDPANGHQPMRSPDGRHTLVFNGSIINFRSLRAELAAHWTFRTDCDTEVLLAAFVRWGEGCLRRLRGMFAFAVWDDRDRTLFFARDPFGIKPLYYRQEGGRLLFASEINALLASGVDAGVDPLSAADYLAWFTVPAPRTIYRGIFCLQPGEQAVFREGKLDSRISWDFSSIKSDEPVCASREDFTRELRVRLEDTIRAHAVADVPVGAFLSGGLDSAVIVALMARAGGARLRTFNIGFAEKGYSEADAAAKVARHLGTDHHTYILSGTEVAGDIGNYLAACDQPTGDGLNSYYASRQARAGGVTVALSGLGGDELFGGYPSFANLQRLAGWLPRWKSLPGWIRRPIIARLRDGDTQKQKLADMLRYASDVHQLGSMQRRVFAEPHRRALLAPALRETVRDRSPFHPQLASLREDIGDADTFAVASAWELRGYMADLLLRDGDVMSMRHSLELRVPFVDRPLIEWLWRQPTAFKYTPGRPKDALAAAVADLLPAGLRGGSKRGFTLPMPIWMRRELKPFLDETFSNGSISRSGLFVRSSVQASWLNFLQGGDTREWSRVWSLAMLISFVNRPTPAAARPQAAAPAIPVISVPKPAPVNLGQGRHTLLMTPELFSTAGGIPRVMRLYLKALCDLAESGEDRVRLLCLNDPVLDSQDLRRYSSKYLEDWYVCSRDKRRFILNARRLARGCERIVCGHVAQLPVAWLASRFRPRTRYYLVAHGIEVWRRFSFLEKLALRGAERIFCVSEFTRGEMLRHYSPPKDKLVVVPNALDPYFEIRPGSPLADCPPDILMVTRLSYGDRYKGVEDMIRAMPAVRAAVPQSRLRIVGHGDDQKRLRSLAARAGLLPHGVEFLGFLDDHRMAEELGRCRLLALPSRLEGFGLVLLEAMANGRPCLGAASGGIPEVLSEETGILVEPGNTSSIARGCIEGLQRSWDQAAILARARHFSFDNFKERLSNLLAS